MSKVLIKAKKLQQSFNSWMGRVNPRLDYLIDKYHIIKVGCVLGSSRSFIIQLSIATSFTTVC
jgi:hypothetical protein